MRLYQTGDRWVNFELNLFARSYPAEFLRCFHTTRDINTRLVWVRKRKREHAKTIPASQKEWRTIAKGLGGRKYSNMSPNES